MVKRLFKWTIAVVVSLSLAISPAFMGGAAFASDGGATGGLDGMTVEQVEQDKNLSNLLNDPMFCDHYTIGDDGIIRAVKDDLEPEYVFTSEDVLTTAAVTKIGKAKIPKKYKSKTRYNAIDISWWQHEGTDENPKGISDANWKKIKNAGITHVIIRVGYRSASDGKNHQDSVFEKYLKGAKKAGMKIGVYYYSAARNPDEALEEAKYTVNLLKDYKDDISLPVAYDYEGNSRITSSVMKEKGTASCKAYCDYVKAAGYIPMVYANFYTMRDKLKYKTLQKKYAIWLAAYTDNGAATSYPGKYCMWQYSSSGKVSGISGKVDINYWFDGVQADIISGSGSPDSAEKTEKTTYKGVTTCQMNYRAGPGTSYEIKGTYSKGTTIQMVSRTGDWAKMKNGYYICLSNVKYSAKTTDSVNYRKGPGTSYKIKGTYSKGTSITIVKVKNGWAKMSNGYWLSAEYTKMK